MEQLIYRPVRLSRLLLLLMQLAWERLMFVIIGVAGFWLGSGTRGIITRRNLSDRAGARRWRPTVNLAVANDSIG